MERQRVAVAQRELDAAKEQLGEKDREFDETQDKLEDRTRDLKALSEDHGKPRCYLISILSIGPSHFAV